MVVFLLPLGSKDLNDEHKMTVASTLIDKHIGLEEGSDPEVAIFTKTYTYMNGANFNHCGLTPREP